MATANFGEGAVFEISDDMISKMVSFDQHLERIAKSSAKINATPFQSLITALNGLKVDNVASLERLAAAMDKLSGATGASQSLNNIAQGAQNVGTSASGANTSLSQTAQLLNQISVSHPFVTLEDGTQKVISNITVLKAGIKDINNRLSKQGQSYIDANGDEQTYKILTQKEQQYLVNRRNLLQQELKIQQASDEAKITSMKRVMDAQNADMLLSEKRIAQARKEYAERAKLSQQQNYKKNTTYQGALDFSSTANTLQRQITAIEYLKKARLSLDPTKDKAKIDELNAAINRHNHALQQAGVQSSNLANRHRNLMDISGQLARQFALLFSVSQVEGYISQIAKVRGEFELQQRSLETILQNKTEADAIFQKTVDLAIKSPFQIKELVSYTKQLAAYRIEGDKLYDTTKRLADVSAGLGVDMQRLILAYGQVKAAAYLRGTEVRQFTEAGVNMYGELQSYFQEVKGEAYTTAQIVDMISKRKVTFEDVEAVFQRLTSQGGLFYNMQEIQSETLNGKIANLKDSFDVMFNSIGKANDGILKDTVDGVKTLIDNWENVANVGEALVAVFAAVKLQSALASEKLLLMAVDMGVLTNTIPKQLTLWQALRTAFIALGKGIASVSKALVSLISKNPYIAAFMALAYAIYEVYDASTRTDEALLENKKTYEENMRAVNALTAEYIQLAAAANKAKQAQANGEKVEINTTQNRNDREKVVRELAGQLEKEGMKIDLSGLSSLTDDQLAGKAKTLAKSYEDVQKAIKGMSDAYDKGANEIEGWWGIFGDNIATDTKDLTSMEDELTSNATAMGTRLDYVGAHYNELSDEAKKYYDTVKDGQDKANGESELEYLERVHNALSKIIQIEKDSSIGNYLQNSAIKMDIDWSGFHSAKDEFLHEVQKMKADFEKQGITDPWMISTAIDHIAAENEWSEYERNLAKREFKVPLVFDTENITQDLDSIGKQLDNYFKGKTYIINIDWNSRDAKGGAQEYESGGEDYLKQYKAVRKQIKRYNAVTKEGGTWSGLSIVDLNTQETDLRKKLIGAGFREEIEALDKNNHTRKNKTTKAERDIWSERISVLKEMQRQYEKVREHYGEDTAKAMTLSEYMPTLQDVNIGAVIKPEDIVPTKQGIVDALVKALSAMPKTLKDYKKKSIDLQKTIHNLKLEIETEEAQKKLEETKKYVEHLFDGLDLHQKLKDVGLSEAEVQALFPGLAKTLDDVELGIHNKYNGLRDKDGNLGTDEQKAYDEEIKNLNQKRIKEQQDLVVELTKAYKTQLSDQLQLDMWYYQERGKIYSKVWDKEAKQWKNTLTPEMQEEYTKNLDTQYSAKTSENTWKDFQKGDFYIGLFENLDNASSRVINAMRDKLNDMRENLKDLPADQLKAIINQIEKLDELSAQKDPFKALSVSLKDYIKFLRERKKLEKDYITANKNIDSLTKEKDAQSKIVAEIQSQYDAEVEKNGVDSEEAKLLKEQLEQEKELLDAVLDRLEAEGKISKEKADQIRNGQNAEKTTTDSLHEIGGYFTGAADIINGGVEALNDWGLNVELSDEMTEVVNGFSKIGNSLNSIDLTKPMSVITGTIGVIGGIGQTLGGIFGWGTKDNKLQKQIEKQQEKIEDLSNAYDKLKEHMNAAWDISKLESYYDQSVDNLEAQIASYKAMIKAEEDKKDTDDDKIKEWKQDIADIEEELAELKENLTESLGGFGSEENYQSAAQAFADAWVDAFNEGEDTLEALNDTFNDYFDNLLKKQLMLRASEKYIQPILDAFDEAVSEDDDSKTKVTKAELERIQALKDKNLEAYNEYAQTLMDILGVTPENSTELSALTQGIESVSETTAEALEALLNSIRFFLATQQGDVAIIRSLLEAHFGTVATTTVQTSASTTTTETSSSNPMLIELKTQTGYLKQMADNFEGCFAYSQNSKGKGMRVYVQ